MKEKSTHNDKLQVPENYFEEFENRLYAELEFQKLFPVKLDGFIVPEGYFENLDAEIRKRVLAQPKVIQLNYRKIATTAVSIAAALALLFYVIKPTPETQDFEGLSISNLESYLLEQERIQDLFSDEELNTIEANTSFFDEDQISEELIYEYVDQDVIEYALNAEN